jgi:hypothetical protein
VHLPNHKNEVLLVLRTGAFHKQASAKLNPAKIAGLWKQNLVSETRWRLTLAVPTPLTNQSITDPPYVPFFEGLSFSRGDSWLPC